MHSKVTFSVFCIIFSTVVYRSAPTTNGVSSLKKVLGFFKVKAAYINFLTNPPPSEVVVPTRGLLEEVVKTVSPIGIVLHRCPENVGIEDAVRWCHTSNIQEVKLEISVMDLKNSTKKIIITPQNHTQCECE